MKWKTKNLSGRVQNTPFGHMGKSPENVWDPEPKCHDAQVAFTLQWGLRAGTSQKNQDS